MTVERSSILKTQPIEALRQRIIQLGANWHEVETKPQLIKRIVMMEMTEELAGDEKEASSTVKEIARNPRLSIEQVEKAVAKYINAGMKIEFLNEDGEPGASNWHFTFDTGRFVKNGRGDEAQFVKVINEDSGSMTMPIKVVEQCAMFVARKQTIAKRAADIMGTPEAA